MTPDQIATKGDVAALNAKMDILLDRLSSITAAPREEWLTVPEAARLLGVTPATIRRRISAGALQAKGSGKLRRVRV